MIEKLTPREEYEARFGVITDDQWQWLKEFLGRNVEAAIYNSGRKFFELGKRYKHEDSIQR